MQEIELPPSYELVRNFFRGKNSSIYLVNHKAKQKKYLAKVITPTTNWRRDLNYKKRIKKEIDFVSSFDHPHISKLEDSLFFDNTYLLFYSYAEGSTLAQNLNKGRPLSIQTSCKITGELLSALEYIHSRGIVHCDVNPNNIFLRDGHKVELFDFGLGLPEKEWKHQASIQLVGTPPYIAPEQAGLTDYRIDQRTDLFCAGMILYRLLSGHFPHRINPKNLSEYMDAMLKLEWLPISGLSERLNQIVKKSLSLDPQDRYQTASGFRFDLDSDGGVVGQQDSLWAIHRHSHFCGRKDELEALNSLLEKLEKGSGSKALFYGKSGVGKTEILREFQSSLKKRKVAAVSVKCNRFTPNHPLSVYFETTLSIIQSLMKTASKETELQNFLNGTLLQHSGLICDVFPDLKPFFNTITAVPKISDEALRDRQHLVLSSLLKGLLRLQSFVITIDDLQWMDKSSHQLLHEISKENPTGLFVLFYRTPEKAKLVLHDLDLRELKWDHLSEVRPFNLREISEFFEKQIGKIQNHKILSDAVFQGTDRTPLTLFETSKHLVHSSVLSFEHNRWIFDIDKIGGNFESLTANELYTRRFGLLPKDEKWFLQSLSLHQGALEVQDLLALGHHATDTNRWVRTLVSQGFLLERMNGQLEFPHDKLQEALEDSLSQKEKTKINLLWAQHFEDRIVSDSNSVYRSYKYYTQAGDFEKSLEVGLKAARYSFESFIYIEAKNYYKACLYLVASNPDIKIPGGANFYSLQKNLADTHIILGENDEALEILSKISGEAKTYSQQEYLDVQAKIGNIYTKKSEYQLASFHFGICLNVLKASIPASNFLCCMNSIWSISIMIFTKPKPSKKYRTSPKQIKLGVMNKQGYSMFFTDLLRSIYIVTKAANISKSSMSGAEECISIVHASVILYHFFFRKKALHYCDVSIKYSEKECAPDISAYIKGMAALVYCYDGSWEVAHSTASNAIASSKEIGSKWHQLFALEYKCLSIFKIGDFKNFEPLLHEYLDVSKQSSDLHFYYKALSFFCIYQQLIHLENTSTEQNIVESAVIQSQDIIGKEVIGSRLIHSYQLSNDWKRAFDFGEKIFEQIKNKFFSHEFLAELLLGHMNTITQLLLDSSSLKKPLLRKLRYYLFFTVLKSFIFKAHSGPTYKATAWYCYFRGWHRLSEYFFRKSIQKCHLYDMKYEEARSYRDYARVMELREQSEQARENFSIAYQLFVTCGARAEYEPLESKVDPSRLVTNKTINREAHSYSRSGEMRLDELYKLSQSINEFKNSNVLLAQILRAFVKGTHAQQGAMEVTFRGSEGPLQLHLDSQGKILDVLPQEISSNSVQWVRENRKALRIREGAKDPLLENIIRPTARSLLCFPLEKDGYFYGFVYLTNNNLSGLFTKNTEKICEILGAQTILLLETYSLLQKQEQLNQKLNKKVGMQKDKLQQKNHNLQSSNRQLKKMEKWRESLLCAAVEDIQKQETTLNQGLKRMGELWDKKFASSSNLQLAKQACGDMAVLVNNLSDVNKMDSGRFPVRKQWVSHQKMFQVMRHCLDHPIFSQKNVTLEMEPCKEQFQVNWDPYLLERVLQNLASNACKYTRPGGTVKASCRMDEEGLLFSLYNSGDPIPVEAAHSVFRKYNRIQQDASSYSKGLGLFFCDLAVKAHRARIWVEPQPEGNTFFILFPKTQIKLDLDSDGLDGSSAGGGALFQSTPP